MSDYLDMDTFGDRDMIEARMQSERGVKRKNEYQPKKDHGTHETMSWPRWIKSGSIDTEIVFTMAQSTFQYI
jgi:hypothetical protein